MKLKTSLTHFSPPSCQLCLTSAIIEFGQRLSQKVNMVAIITDVHGFVQENFCGKNDNGREKAT